MIIRNKIALGAVACFLSTAGVSMSTSVYADNAGAFLGGVFVSKIVSNSRRQTEAQEEQAAAAKQQAAAAQQQAQRSVPAAPAQKSAKQRIQELDSLAAGGYISKEEYKRKKQAIIDSL